MFTLALRISCCILAPSVQRRGGHACCGVTTGQLFCAMVGSQRRSEYTVFGEQGGMHLRSKDCVGTPRL